MGRRRQFTDSEGRAFCYIDGHRVYNDGGKDVGTPVPYRPKNYPGLKPRPITPPAVPSRGLLLEKRKLSSMLAAQLRISVPIESLLGRETRDDLLAIVLPLIPHPGATFEQRRALEKRVFDMSVASYQWARNQVTCSFDCPNCGRRLGAEALQLADDHYSRRMDEVHRNNPGCLISLIRDADAVCPHCGVRYFYTAKRELAPVEDPDRPAPSPQKS